MSKLFIVSRRKFINTEMIFKRSFILEGYVNNIASMRAEYAFLCNLINFHNPASYNHILVLKKNDPALLNWLILQESDFYIFEATRHQLVTLRRTHEQLKSGEEIMRSMTKLRFSDISMIVSSNDFYLEIVGQNKPCKTDIHQLTCDLADAVLKEYFTFFIQKIITTRNSLVTYYSLKNI